MADIHMLAGVDDKAEEATKAEVWHQDKEFENFIISDGSDTESEEEGEKDLSDDLSEMGDTDFEADSDVDSEDGSISCAHCGVRKPPRVHAAVLKESAKRKSGQSDESDTEHGPRTKRTKLPPKPNQDEQTLSNSVEAIDSNLGDINSSESTTPGLARAPGKATLPKVAVGESKSVDRRSSLEMQLRDLLRWEIANLVKKKLSWRQDINRIKASLEERQKSLEDDLEALERVASSGSRSFARRLNSFKTIAKLHKGIKEDFEEIRPVFERI